jgi:hypothetical protein
MKSEVQKVKELGEDIGYGHMMYIASALWRKMLKDKWPGTEIGAFMPALRCNIVDDVELQSIIDKDIELYDKIINE